MAQSGLCGVKRWIVLKRLVNKGVVVVASIGNSGASGPFAAGAPGVGKKVIGTASFDNTYVYLPYFEVNGAKIGYVDSSVFIN